MVNPTHKQIALHYLPPDENVPSDLPEKLRSRLIGLNAFVAKRSDGGEFVAVWGCGGIVDGELLTSQSRVIDCRCDFLWGYCLR